MSKQLLLFLLLFSACNMSSQVLTSEGISKELLLGKINYRTNKGFVKVDSKYCSKTTFLNKEVYHAFLEMYNSAKNDGIELRIVSGARNFDHQKAIWERKWKDYNELDPQCRTQKILEYSSMPSTSRHHWGTDIDLNNLENAYFTEGTGKTEYEWLVKNAPLFGFYQVYTSKDAGRTGYAEEKWHWSYLPLAGRYLEAYNKTISYQDISGFDGCQLAEVNQMITAYVNGIARQHMKFTSVKAPLEQKFAAHNSGE